MPPAGRSGGRWSPSPGSRPPLPAGSGNPIQAAVRPCHRNRAAPPCPARGRCSPSGERGRWVRPVPRTTRPGPLPLPAPPGRRAGAGRRRRRSTGPGCPPPAARARGRALPPRPSFPRPPARSCPAAVRWLPRWGPSAPRGRRAAGGPRSSRWRPSAGASAGPGHRRPRRRSPSAVESAGGYPRVPAPRFRRSAGGRTVPAGSSAPPSAPGRRSR